MDEDIFDAEDEDNGRAVEEDEDVKPPKKQAKTKTSKKFIVNI